MNINKLVTLTVFLISFVNPSFIRPLLAEQENLIIEDAWIAEAPPVSKVMVAYMTINNPTAETIEITGAESDLYSSIEFHETIHENDMARMIRHDSLSIKAGNRLELKRGGPHLMLFNPKKPLSAGDIVEIKLTTDNNQSMIISVAVKKARY